MNASFIILSVSQLNTYVRSVLDADRRLSGVFVRGEISNFTNHYRSGHFYLTLKDENASIKAVMFKISAQRLKFMPYDGMKVIVIGRASIYDRDGQYQFYIEDMQPDGVGALHIAYEQLKEKLSLEGLFDEDKKRPLPKYPMRIGVVTSPTGAAIADIESILARRWPLAEIILYPVLVQGDVAPVQICKAIEYLNLNNCADVIIVGRGGGSIEELWAFNNENVARCVANSKIPVVSAVGHETDYTITDFASDLRAATPSAAAELVSPDITDTVAFVDGINYNMRTILNKKLADYKRRYEKAVSARALRVPMNIIEMKHLRLDFLNIKAIRAVKAVVNAKGYSFATLTAKLDSLSPLKVLARGYAIPSSQSGKIIMSEKALSPGDDFKLQLNDGIISCKVLYKNS